MWAGGSGYFSSVTVRMDLGYPLRSSPCRVSGASVHVETLHHRRPVLTQELWEDLPPNYTISKEMSKNGKDHNSVFKCSPLTTDRCEITMRGRVEKGKPEFLTYKPVLLLVNLTPVPKCPQILSQVQPQRPLPRDHMGPQMGRNVFIQRMSVFSRLLKRLEQIRLQLTSNSESMIHQIGLMLRPLCIIDVDI